MFRAYDLHVLVQDFGQEVTLRKVTNSGGYDPLTASLSGSATADYPIKAYFHNYDLGLVVDRDDVRRGRRRCVISAMNLDVEPDDEDQILGLGDTVNILSVSTIFSNGQKICYLCDVRE